MAEPEKMGATAKAAPKPKGRARPMVSVKIMEEVLVRAGSEVRVQENLEE
jgi:hypothetical protein